ncbi:MAG: hypothetical protein HY246_00230, partial [Proteobacteria bacterium]|nr:hypothetical protein [Pseudomonadota bacterium]
FGGFAVIAARRGWRQGWAGAEIRIDERGLSDSRLVDPLIAWGDMAAICCRGYYGQRFIDIRPNDPAVYVQRLDAVSRRLARLNQALGFGPYSLALAGLDASEDEVIAAIARFKPAALPLVVLD